MSGRNTLPQTIFMTNALAFLAAASYFPFAGRNLGLVAAAASAVATSLIPSGDLLFGRNAESERLKQNVLCMLRSVLFASAAAFAVFTAARGNPLALALPKDTVCRLEGRLIQDSAFSVSGNYIVKVKVQSCASMHGYTATAHGIATSLGKEKALVSYGTKVRLTGRFSGELFIFDELLVLERSGANDIRENAIQWLEARLFGQVPTDGEPGGAELLSTLLLLGRSEDHGFALKDLAQKCGCSHVLALSGMHLGILAAICRVFGKKGKGLVPRLLSFAFVGTFVFIAGPRPSLIRAAIMFCLWFLPPSRRLCLSFLLQTLLFPTSMADLGCCYGYMAVAAIVFLQGVSYTPIATFIGKRTLSSPWLSATVLLYCAPAQIITTGGWNPIAILISPIAGFLAAASMSIGLLLIVFGRVGLLLGANKLVFGLFERLFSTFSELPPAGWPEYIAMVASMLALNAFALAARHFVSKRTKPLVSDVEAPRRKVMETCM